MFRKLSIIAAAAMLLAGCSRSHEHGAAPPTYIFPPPPNTPIPQPRPEPRPGFQTLDTIEDSILLDLQNLDSNAIRQDSRYFVGCDRLNLGQDVAEFEQGINRGINALSTERELYKATPIGPGNCIYRVELDRIGWTASDWNLLAQNDVLFFESNTVRAKNIAFLQQSKRGYVYGSSAMITAFEGHAVADKRGKVYYGLMKQDINTSKFFAQQGLDRQVEVNNEEAIFSAFSESQIALQKSRMIAVYRSRDGTCIETYDTIIGGDDTFRNPFTKELISAQQINGNVLSTKLFKHDAQEVICSLPNSMFSLYRLSNAAEVGQSVAPTNVVTNLIGAREDPSIRLGDCVGCHYKLAAIPFRDQMNKHILTNTAFDQKEKNLAQIFFKYDKITARLDQLNKENARALEELGITAQEDPLWNTVTKPLRQEMSIDQVASLLWMDTATFKDKLSGAAVSSQVFGNLISGGKVSLATLSGNFAKLIEETRAYEDDEL